MVRPRYFIAITCLMLATGLGVSGCGDPEVASPTPEAAKGMRLKGDFTGAGLTPGALASATSLPTIDRRLRAVTSVAARIEYTSTSAITNEHTQVTGTVFAPKGRPPVGGWPVVAYGHPTTGIRSECAPSLSPTLLNSSVAVGVMVKAGYVVTVTDYQGLGLDRTHHPFLDPGTAGYNLIDSVRAARKLVPDTSDRWVAVGSSQGGQAAWAANELAAQYGAGLTLVGSASLSPPADIVGFAQAAASGGLTKEQQPAFQLILASLKNAYPDLNLDDYRRGIVADRWDVLSACRGSATEDRKAVVDAITADDLRPSSPEAAATLLRHLQKMSLPQRPAVAPMLVIYGGQDQLIPAAWTDHALVAACELGDVIDIQMQPDKGHSNIDISTTFDWISDRFLGVPPPNSCGLFTPAAVAGGLTGGSGLGPERTGEGG
jgi:pimeloyl-ACP methyl ester carboxylesterase